MTCKHRDTEVRAPWTERSSYKTWRTSMELRHGRDPAELIGSAAALLVRQYATASVLKHPHAVVTCRERLSSALEYHWWRFCEQGIRPLTEVVKSLQKGYCAAGRIRVDFLREVVLTEGVCRRDPVATSEFFSDYGNVISSAAYRTGGRQARQDTSRGSHSRTRMSGRTAAPSK